MTAVQPGSVVRLETPATGPRAAAAPITPDFSLPADEVHVWQSALGEDDAGPWANFLMLSEAEQERAARFRRERDQTRFIHAHVLLRSVLAGYTQRHPAELRFTASAFGKPALDGQEGAAALSFSLTYAGDLALVAVTSGRPSALMWSNCAPICPICAWPSGCSRRKKRRFCVRCQQKGRWWHSSTAGPARRPW